MAKNTAKLYLEASLEAIKNIKEIIKKDKITIQ